MLDILRSLLNTLLPARCAGCGERLCGDERWLCGACVAQLSFNRHTLPGDCETGWSAAAAVFGFTPAVRRLIHMLKYEETTRVGEFLGGMSVRFMQEVAPYAMPDVVAPVPLHRTRKRHRGYNQSLLLAREIARGTGAELSPELVKRHRHTATQAHLGRNERQSNVRGAFIRNPLLDMRGRSVMLVDDVFTTGATVTEAARALLDDGDAGYGAAKQVFVLTIARA